MENKVQFTLADFEEGLKLSGHLSKGRVHENELVHLKIIDHRLSVKKDNRHNLGKFPRWRNVMHVFMFWAKEHAYYKSTAYAR